MPTNLVTSSMTLRLGKTRERDRVKWRDKSKRGTEEERKITEKKKEKRRMEEGREKLKAVTSSMTLEKF